MRLRNKSLKKDLQLLFLHRLARLLGNGYTLLEALDVIKWDDQLAATATEIISALRNGQTLDQAFEKANFSHLITSYLYFVRANGDIQTSIEKCIFMFEQRQNYTRKFKQTTRYPLLLLFIFSILLFFMKQSVLPSFINLFQTHSETPATILIAIMIIDYLSNFIIVIFVLLIIGVFLWQINKSKIPIETQIKYFSLLPIYRKYKQLQVSFLFATHFSSMLKTGMSFKEILKIMSQQEKLPIITYYANLMTQELYKGFHIANLLSQFTLFEKQLPIIFQKNTDTNALEKDLSTYAELLTEELQRKITKIITYIQPTFFLIIALFIIVIYISLMWPMFQLIKTI